MTGGAVRVDTRTLLLVGLLALAAAAPSLANGFAYDDQWIIVTNRRVHDLARWQEWFTTAYWPTLQGSLYRPLTTTGFALQWAVGGGTPFVFHALNVLLYVAGAVAFTWLASLLLPATAAIVVGALFAVHPIHVEAVGNVVGQSELSAGLVMLAALALYVRGRRRGALGPGDAAAIGALYLVGVLLKEHALVLPAWLAAAELTVLRDAEPMRARVRFLARPYLAMALIGLLALVARYQVLGQLGGDIPHPAIIHTSVAERAFIMLGVLPDLARLLVWPARLYTDYSPAHITIASGPDVSQLNGLLVAAGAVVVFVVAWRRSATAALGLLIAALAWFPTSNLLFPSGILLAERTLYLPSAGALLAIGAGVAWFDRRVRADLNARRAAAAVLATVLVLGVARSVERQRVWRSSVDVFWTMVRDEPLSFKAHYAWGGVLFERGDLAGGEREWRMAIRIFPEYHKIYQDLAHQYRENGLCRVAIPTYEQALELDGGLPLSRAGLLACQLELARFSDARRTALAGIADGNDPAWFRARLASADSALAAADSIR